MRAEEAVRRVAEFKPAMRQVFREGRRQGWPHERIASELNERVKHTPRCRSLPNWARAMLQGYEDRLWEELLGTSDDVE
jgi:hypothetical protein